MLPSTLLRKVHQLDTYVVRRLDERKANAGGRRHRIAKQRCSERLQMRKIGIENFRRDREMFEPEMCLRAAGRKRFAGLLAGDHNRRAVRRRTGDEQVAFWTDNLFRYLESEC